MKMPSELVEFAKEADEQMARDYHEGFFRMSEKLRLLDMWHGCIVTGCC
ncbi:hypothetical protein [Xanthomonas axonopodis]|nr:hypothetical protein [Xanthomonas axonopodis]